MFKSIGIRLRSRKARKKRIINNASIEHKSIGIITTKEIVIKPEYKIFSDNVSKKGYDIQTLIFSAKKLKEHKDEHFDKKSFDWKGKISSPLVKEFVKTPFDFLFSINTSSNLQIENVLALSKAKCRIGANLDEINKNLDFVVNLNSSSKDSIKDLTDNILEYTERIS